MPHRWTLARMQQEIAARRISSAELLAAHRAQISKLNPLVRAFVEQYFDEIRLDLLPAGPLHGIPVTVKDSFDIACKSTLCGSRLREGHMAAYDSAVVRRLRAAGAVILGKTNTPEMLANYETDNYITGFTANPWNVEFSAGGSSGGEAAAIAGCMSAGGVGSDGGGSIRLPAHFCGIAGLKPTPGRISAAGHAPEIEHPGGLLGVAGPMARTAGDLKILFEVLAGYDAADPFSAPVPLRPGSIEGLRVGIVDRFRDVPLQPDVQRAFEQAVRAIGELKLASGPFEPPAVERAVRTWDFFFNVLTAPFKREFYRGREGDVHWTGNEFLDPVPEDRVLTGQEVALQLSARDRMRSALLEQMREMPVLLTPVCSTTAFRPRERTWQIEGRTVTQFRSCMPLTFCNALGLPALVIPMVVGNQGLPAGVQLIGRPWEEENLLELACRLEQVRGPFPHPAYVE